MAETNVKVKGVDSGNAAGKLAQSQVEIVASV